MRVGIHVRGARHISNNSSVGVTLRAMDDLSVRRKERKLSSSNAYEMVFVNLSTYIHLRRAELEEAVKGHRRWEFRKLLPNEAPWCIYSPKN